MLQLAQTTWELIAVYQISEDNARSGKHPERSTTFSSSCSGSTWAICYLSVSQTKTSQAQLLVVSSIL
jgi:hypothetical protein